MLNNNNQSKSKFPKRRKSKDNPYTIGYDENEKSYFLTFHDKNSTKQQIYIEKELYQVFNNFELEDLSQMNANERHVDSAELTEEYVYKHLSYLPYTIEEELEKKLMSENIKNAIKALSPTQRRRLILYYFEGFTYEQIAVIERCKYQSVQKVIKTAEEKIKKFFSK